MILKWSIWWKEVGVLSNNSLLSHNNVILYFSSYSVFKILKLFLAKLWYSLAFWYNSDLDNHSILSIIIFSNSKMFVYLWSMFKILQKLTFFFRCSFLWIFLRRLLRLLKCLVFLAVLGCNKLFYWGILNNCLTPFHPKKLLIIASSNDLNQKCT